MECLTPHPVATGNGHSPSEPAAPAGRAGASAVGKTPSTLGHNSFHPDRNPGGWDELVLSHRAFMLRYALSFTRQRETAEEIVQEAFLAMLTLPWNFSPHVDNALRQWLKRQVRLAASRVLKPWRTPLKMVPHRKRHHLVGDRPARKHEITPEDYARLYTTVKRAVRKRFREAGWRAFESVYEQGIDTRETAAAMGISANSVYIYGCRIFSAMREEAQRVLAGEA